MPTIADQVPETDQFVLPTGEQVYDSIMSRIEPELMLQNLETLDDSYVGESESEHDARYERYAEAFKKYREEYNTWVTSLQSAVTAYRKAVVRASEKVSKTMEDSMLESLSSQMLAS